MCKLYIWDKMEPMDGPGVILAGAAPSGYVRRHVVELDLPEGWTVETSDYGDVLVYDQHGEWVWLAYKPSTGNIWAWPNDRCSPIKVGNVPYWEDAK